MSVFRFVPGSIPRKAMPQIKSSRREDFVWALCVRGHAVERYFADPQALRPSQAELHEENVQALMGKPEKLRLPIMVSQDGYVLDGHHRWEALRRLGREVEVIFLRSLCAREALQEMEAFAARYEDCTAKD